MWENWVGKAIEQQSWSCLFKSGSGLKESWSHSLFHPPSFGILQAGRPEESSWTPSVLWANCRIVGSGADCGTSLWGSLHSVLEGAHKAQGFKKPLQGIGFIHEGLGVHNIYWHLKHHSADWLRKQRILNESMATMSQWLMGHNHGSEKGIPPTPHPPRLM